MAALLRFYVTSQVRIFIRSFSSVTSGQNVTSGKDGDESRPDIESETSENETSDFTEEQLNELRDVSRMPKKYHDRLLHVLNPPEPLDYYNAIFQSQTTRRRIFSKYGSKSGIAAGIAWPSEEELQEMVQFEKEWEPSLHSMWKKTSEEKILENRERKVKAEYVEKQLAKMPEYINQYKVKLAKADERERQQQEERRSLQEEARDFFGYDLDPRDPRFEKMQLEKEEEEKKLKKKKKREEKLAKLVQLMKS